MERGDWVGLVRSGCHGTEDPVIAIYLLVCPNREDGLAFEMDLPGWYGNPCVLKKYVVSADAMRDVLPLLSTTQAIRLIDR